MNLNEYSNLYNEKIELIKESYERAKNQGEKEKARRLSNTLYGLGHEAYKKINDEIRIVEVQIRDERDVEERNSLRTSNRNLRIVQKDIVNFLNTLIQEI